MRLAASMCFMWMMGATVVAQAIDNPDAPDFVAAFNERANKYEDEIQNKAPLTEDVRQAYAEYERFLNAELDKAYKALLPKLSGPARVKLKRSQDGWHKFQRSEFAFIARNWTAKTSGSSSVLSRGGLPYSDYSRSGHDVIALLEELLNAAVRGLLKILI